VWLIIVAAALYLWYATIVTRRNKVQEALTSVDVHRNQRHDLIPNIVSLAGRFMEHERALLTEVTRLREQARTATPTTPAEVSRRFCARRRVGTAGVAASRRHGSLSRAQVRSTGAYAIATGLREVALLAWRWNAPLRTLKRP